MGFDWFRQRTYRHFDRPVGVSFLEKVSKPEFVARHPFSPLISRPEDSRRYKRSLRKTVTKRRPIMYACHRDAAIFAWYSRQISDLLEKYYEKEGLSESVIAYRALGKGNYLFSADAHAFAVKNSPCTILAFDVTGFFDNLSHTRLKTRLKELLKVKELPEDWYAVFKAVTKFRFVEHEALRAHPSLVARFAASARGPIATIAEIKKLSIPLKECGAHLDPPRPPSGKGIPQGTPLSAALSNAYMTVFDRAMREFCDEIGALYRRYSDDILVICPRKASGIVEGKVAALLREEGLELSAAKTEKTDFGSDVKIGRRSAQYLGFSYYPGGAGLRPSSLARAWRKMRRAVDAAKTSAMKSGGKLRTKKLHKRFSSVFDPVGRRYLRNFPAYALRSATAFGPNEKISRQLRRFQRGLAARITAAKKEIEP